MKLKHLFTTAIVALALAVPAIAEEDTPLTKEMEKISKILKGIGRAAKEGTLNKDMAAKVADAKLAVDAAAKLEPAKTKEVPAAEKEKFLADYKVAMTEMGKDLDALKAAIEAGKNDEAGKILEKLNTGKKDGHKKFKSEE
jgi:soluble cytochrome b562